MWLTTAKSTTIPRGWKCGGLASWRLARRDRGGPDRLRFRRHTTARDRPPGHPAPPGAVRDRPDLTAEPRREPPGHPRQPRLRGSAARIPGDTDGDAGGGAARPQPRDAADA